MTPGSLLEALERQGLRRGGLLMIHSSMKGLHPFDGSPASLVAALAEFAGAGGALFPLFTGSPEDSARRPPRLDVSSAGHYTGAVPKAALELFGAQSRSLHPTHSVAASPGAAGLIARHHGCRTPCGPGSPIRETAERDGQVLLLGVGFESLTLIHAAEEAAEVPYVCQPEPAVCTCIDAGGREVLTPPIFLHSWLPPRNYRKLEPECEAAGVARQAALDGRKAWIVEAGPFFRHAVSRLKQDPEWGVA